MVWGLNGCFEYLDFHLIAGLEIVMLIDYFLEIIVLFCFGAKGIVFLLFSYWDFRNEVWKFIIIQIFADWTHHVLVNDQIFAYFKEYLKSLKSDQFIKFLFQFYHQYLLCLTMQSFEHLKIFDNSIILHYPILYFLSLLNWLIKLF
jgi:hypothetical protein